MLCWCCNIINSIMLLSDFTPSELVVVEELNDGLFFSALGGNDDLLKVFLPLWFLPHSRTLAIYDHVSPKFKVLHSIPPKYASALQISYQFYKYFIPQFISLLCSTLLPMLHIQFLSSFGCITAADYQTGKE